MHSTIEDPPQLQSTGARHTEIEMRNGRETVTCFGGSAARYRQTGCIDQTRVGGDSIDGASYCSN